MRISDWSSDVCSSDLENESIEFGPYVLNLSTRTLTRNNEPVPITTGEFSVLKVFARHPKIPLSRDKLMELARGREYEAFDRSLDVQISRLRKLVDPHPSKTVFIQTVWGLGYAFVPDRGRCSFAGEMQHHGLTVPPNNQK